MEKINLQTPERKFRRSLIRTKRMDMIRNINLMSNAFFIGSAAITLSGISVFVNLDSCDSWEHTFISVRTQLRNLMPRHRERKFRERPQTVTAIIGTHPRRGYNSRKLVNITSRKAVSNKLIEMGYKVVLAITKDETILTNAPLHIIDQTTDEILCMDCEMIKSSCVCKIKRK